MTLVLLSTLALTSAPYVYGWAIRPPGTRFWAVPPINSGDANQYLAFIRIASEGRLLIGDPFTSEPHAPRLFLPQTLFQGLLCRLPGWSPIGAFQASRVLWGAGLLVAGFWFGMLLLPRWRQRLLFLGFLCFSAGAGWFVDHLGWRVPHGDFLQPEGNTFYTLGNLPNLSLASALLTALFAALLAMERDPRPRWIVFTLAAALLLSWTHPFDFLTLGMGLGAYCLTRALRDRRLPRASLLHAGALVLGALPAAAYLTWITRVDPIYRALANDILQVQDFKFYAIAHGPLALPALAVLFNPRLRARYALPLCWVLCVFLFLLTPFRLGGKQPRLVGGIHVPLALLATAGLDSISRRKRPGASSQHPTPNTHTPTHPHTHTRGRARPATLLCLGYLLLTATGSLNIMDHQLYFYRQRAPDFYMSPAVQRLYEYLERAGDRGQVTLGGTYTGGWAPTWTDTRVYYGHWHMTLREPEKHAERNWFFTAPADPAARAAWLREKGITWVIWYPWEWGGRVVPLEDVPGLHRVYTTPEIFLYRYDARAG